MHITKKHVVFNKLLFVCLLFSCIQDLTAHAKSNFIENIFEVKIPGLQGAYNPSIVDFEDGYLMAFRFDSYKEPIGLHLEDYRQFIGIVLLDQNFKPKAPWQLCVGDRAYDPRLLKVDDTIYMIFASPSPGDPHSCLSSRLNLCTIQYEDNAVKVSNLHPLSSSIQQPWEKNWVLFNYDNKIHLEYSISPHVILQASLDDGSCIECNDSSTYNTKSIRWPYGIIRGGTPALLVDGKYLGFFHSSKIDTHKKKYTYYIGAYTFIHEPPFKIDYVSTVPFHHPDFYTTPKNAKTNSHVIFPGGFVMKNNRIFLCYGENDDAIKIMVLDKRKLYVSMRKIKES